MDKLEDILIKIRKSYAVRFEPLVVDDATFEILEIENMPSLLDKLISKKMIKNPLRDLPLWAKVWPASLVLGRFMRKLNPEGKTMLEIGAGMGICSLLSSRYGLKKITASDIAGDALDFMTANILKNGLEDIISVANINITTTGTLPGFQDGPDFITGSEILYIEDLHRPLCKFISRNLKADGKVILCADIGRAAPRFKKQAEKLFSVQEGHIGVKTTSESGEEEKRIYTLYILENK